MLSRRRPLDALHDRGDLRPDAAGDARARRRGGGRARQRRPLRPAGLGLDPRRGARRGARAPDRGGDGDGQRRPAQLRRARAADGRLEGLGARLAPRPRRDPQVHEAPVADGHPGLRALARRPSLPLQRRRRARRSARRSPRSRPASCSPTPSGRPWRRSATPSSRRSTRRPRTPATRTASGGAPPRTPRSPRGSRSRCCRPSSPTSRSTACAGCSTRSPRAGWPPRPRPSCASRSCTASATRAPRRWPGSRRCATSPRPSSTRSRTSAPAATRPGTRSATRARSPRRPTARGRWRCIAPAGAEELIEADVCVVGSGAGGGVIAGELAAAGKSVVRARDGRLPRRSRLRRARALGLPAHVPERRPVPDRRGAGRDRRRHRGRRRHRDQLDQLPAHPRLGARRVGRASTGSRGSTGPSYDAHLDAVWERLGVNDECSDLNGPHRRLEEACEKLGYDFRTITRNADRDRYDPESAAYMGFGDQSGSKLSTAKTYLLDAQRAGATIVSDCRVERILVEDGRAAGVEAVYTDPEAPANGGSPTRVVVRAPVVVVACGSIESPALLLRSQIGGPAVGDYLRLHPTAAVTAYYSEPQQLVLGPAAGGALARVRRPRRRPRLPDRGGAVDHRPVRGRGALALGRRPQAADARVGARVAADQPPARARPRPGRDRRRRQRGPRLPGHRRARHPRHPRRGRAAGPGPRGRRRRPRSSAAPARPPTGSAATTSRRSSPSSASSRSSRASSCSSRPIRWAPAGWAPTRGPRSPTRGASCTTRPASGSATRAPSRPPRAPTRC